MTVKNLCFFTFFVFGECGRKFEICAQLDKRNNCVYIRILFRQFLSRIAHNSHFIRAASQQMTRGGGRQKISICKLLAMDFIILARACAMCACGVYYVCHSHTKDLPYTPIPISFMCAGEAKNKIKTHLLDTPKVIRHDCCYLNVFNGGSCIAATITLFNVRLGLLSKYIPYFDVSEYIYRERAILLNTVADAK